MTHSGSQKMSTRRGLTVVELLIVLTIIATLMSLILPAISKPREAARTAQCISNLKQIALGLQNYRETYGVFPPAYTTDSTGRRLHSWRTLILPSMGWHKISELIDFSKPWDDPVNSKAFQELFRLYRCPNSITEENRTLYLGVTGKNGCFDGAIPRSLKEITDKPEETLMVVEVRNDQAVPWMAPLDADEKMILDFTAETKWVHPTGRQGVFADGHVETLGSGKTAAELKRMMTIAGGD